MQVLPRHVLRRSVQKSCQEVSYSDRQKSSFRDLVRTSCRETSSGDLVQKHGIEILLQRSCQQTSFRDLVPKSHTEILEICAEILPRGLLHKSCQKKLSREPVQKFGERSCTQTLHRDLLEILPREQGMKSTEIIAEKNHG